MPIFYQFDQLPNGLAYLRQEVNKPAIKQAGVEVIGDGIVQRAYQKTGVLPENFRVYAQVQNHGQKWPGKLTVYLLAAAKSGSAIPNLKPTSVESLKGTALKANFGGWKLVGKKNLQPSFRLGTRGSSRRRFRPDA